MNTYFYIYKYTLKGNKDPVPQRLQLDPALGLTEAMDYDNGENTFATEAATATYIQLNEVIGGRLRRTSILNRLAEAGLPEGCGDGTFDAQARRFYLLKSGLHDHAFDAGGIPCPYVVGVQEIYAANTSVQTFTASLEKIVNSRQYNQIGIATQYRYIYPLNNLLDFCVILATVWSSPSC